MAKYNAVGPEQLTDALLKAANNQKLDPQSDEVILFKLGNSTSVVLLKDGDKVYYNNLEGRPAPGIVKQAIAKFQIAITQEQLAEHASQKSKLHEELIRKVAEKSKKAAHEEQSTQKSYGRFFQQTPSFDVSKEKKQEPGVDQEPDKTKPRGPGG